MDILVKNIKIVNEDEIKPDADLLLQGGVIRKIGTGLDAKAGRVIDGRGLVAFPGFLDLHSHLRDPGLTYKEDIVSGTKAAAAGGYTAVCCMPNTQPAADNTETVKYMIEKAAKQGFADVLPVAAITQGMKGETLTDFDALLGAGAVAFSDDGLPVASDDLIREAMIRGRELGMLLMLHEEDLALRADGVVNAGENAARAGLKGIPNAVEECMTARDIMFAEQLGARIHICHVSTEGSVELVRRAKARGVNVTCETGPHYYSATDEWVANGNPNAKVNPPLRSERDRQAVCRGIADGTIDAVATDHAPHSAEEKAQPIESAPFGLIGFETAFALTVTNLLDKGIIKLSDIARLFSATPHRLLRREGGRIRENETADLAICNPNEVFRYEEANVVSKAKNSPFLGMQLKGRVRYTIRRGRITYDRQAD